jgi:uncharacterized protein (DUF983 family)
MGICNFMMKMASFNKNSKIISIVRLKCPRCHEGNLFLNKNPYNLKMLDKMPKRCPVCDLDLQQEVGFYYGAMMISHALTTVIAVIVHFTVFHYYGWNIPAHLIFLLTIIIGLFPVIFRLARSIWIHMFIRYEPKNKF